MDVWTLKLISIPIIAAVNFITGFLPYFFITRNMRLHSHAPEQNSSLSNAASLSSNMKRFLTLANFFCGGVFLAMCIIGLYPGVDVKFNNIAKKNPSIPHYPYAGLTLAFGFFFVWLLEILVHSCIHCSSQSNHSHSSPYHSNHSHNSPSSRTTERVNNITKNSDTVTMTSFNSPTPDIEDKLITNCDDDVAKLSHEVKNHEPHSHVPLSGNILGSIMLTFALGSHSVIEGLGFGVLDEINVTINMLITMLIHESICAISLGVNIASKKTSLKPAVVLILIFSILIPVGIAIGLIVDSGLQKNIVGEVTVAVLQGVAAGTFIYVVFMEILPNEMSHRKDAFLRLVIMAIGFAVIAGMKATHSHSHSLQIKNQTFEARSTPLYYTH